LKWYLDIGMEVFRFNDGKINDGFE